MQQTVVNERYSIVHILGSGGMAKVYLAHDEVLDRDVALKVLREQFANLPWRASCRSAWP